MSGDMLLPEGPPACVEARQLMMLRGLSGEGPGELSLEEEGALRAHLACCEDCRREEASLRALAETLQRARAPEPSAQLLSQTRQRLQFALDAEARRSWFPRMLTSNVRTMRTAPFAAAAMLLMGAGIGGFSGYEVATKANPDSAAVRTAHLMAASDAPVAGVTSVAPRPDGKGVTVGYNVLVPASSSGSTDDPAIRHLLALGVKNPTGPVVQDDAVRYLADACAHGPQCNDEGVRGALMTAARYEGDADMRTAALMGLQPYVAQDQRVRDAVLESLMSDADPAVRTHALDMLTPVDADSSVQQVLHNVSANDRDPQIRTRSREALDVGMQIQ